MIRYIVLTALFLAQSIVAQDFQGTATYSTDRKMEIKLDSTKVNSEMQQQLQEMMRKQFQKEFSLRFNKTESFYKEEENLGAPQPTSGIYMTITGEGGSDVIYKNTKEERFVGKRDLFGKAFLVKDVLEKYEWKLENDTKKIGNYTCYKATTKGMQKIITRGNGTAEAEDVTEEIEIVAWYTPEIPINTGPSTYWGLPGLILEVTNGDQRILCNKIVLNPKKKVEIKEPTKGKEVTESEYKTILRKKLKEVNDHHRPRNGEDSFSIQIRG